MHRTHLVLALASVKNDLALAHPTHSLLYVALLIIVNIIVDVIKANILLAFGQLGIGIALSASLALFMSDTAMLGGH